MIRECYRIGLAEGGWSWRNKAKQSQFIMLRLRLTAYGWQFDTGPRDRKKCLRGLEVENSRRVTTPETLSRSDGEDKPIDQQTPLLCRTPGRIGEHVALDKLTAHAPRKQM